MGIISIGDKSRKEMPVKKPPVELPEKCCATCHFSFLPEGTPPEHETVHCRFNPPTVIGNFVPLPTNTPVVGGQMKIAMRLLAETLWPTPSKATKCGQWTRKGV